MCTVKKTGKQKFRISLERIEISQKFKKFLTQRTTKKLEEQAVEVSRKLANFLIAGIKGLKVCAVLGLNPDSQGIS